MPSSAGRLRSSGALRKCSSIAWKPASISREALGPDRDHRREPDRRAHRVAPADPVPEAEHVRRCRCRTPRPPPRSSRRRRSAARPRRRSRAPASAQARALRALVIVSSVVNVFEETTNSVSAGSRSRVASAKSVPSTLETNRNVRSRRAVVAQRLVRHHRPQVGPADPDVDDVADRPAGVTAPLAAAHARANAAIRSSTSWTCAHDVVAVDAGASARAASAAPRGAQRGPRTR